MSREKDLVKNTFIVAIGKLCTQFIIFFLLPLYTYILTTSEYGTVDLITTYVNLLIPIVFFQLDQGAFRFLIDLRNNSKKTKNFINTILLTFFYKTLLFVSFGLIICLFIKTKYKYFLIANVISTGLSMLLLQISRGMGDNKTYSIGSLISGSFTIILNVVFLVFLKFRVEGMLLATFISTCLCSLYVFLKKKIYKNLDFKCYNKKIRQEIYKYTLPLIPNQLSWWIITVSDRTIISLFLGVAANGIYSAANKFSTICITLFSIFSLTWSESASLAINDKDRDIFMSKIINESLRIFISLIIGIIAFMPFVFKYFIVGEEYSSAYLQIPILLISTIFNIVVSLLGGIYVAQKDSKKIAKTSVYSAMINLLVNILLIKYIGLFAASISTLIAYLSMAIYRYYDVKKQLNIKIEKRFILSSIILLAFILIFYYLKNRYLNLLGIVLAIIFAFTNTKKLIYDIIKNLQIKYKRRKNI